MAPRRRGAIVTMASLAAFNGAGPGAAAYAAAKGARQQRLFQHGHSAEFLALGEQLYRAPALSAGRAYA